MSALLIGLLSCSSLAFLLSYILVSGRNKSLINETTDLNSRLKLHDEWENSWSEKYNEAIEENYGLNKVNEELYKDFNFLNEENTNFKKANAKQAEFIKGQREKIEELEVDINQRSIDLSGYILQVIPPNQNPLNTLVLQGKTYKHLGKELPAEQYVIETARMYKKDSRNKVKVVPIYEGKQLIV